MQDQDVVWLRLGVVAKRIGVSPETARQLIFDEKIKGVRHSVRGWFRVREEECNRYLAELESGQRVQSAAELELEASR